MNGKKPCPPREPYWEGHFKVVPVDTSKAGFDTHGTLYYDAEKTCLRLFDVIHQIPLIVQMHQVHPPKSSMFPKGNSYPFQFTHQPKDGSTVDCELQFSSSDEAARLNLHKFLIAEQGSTALPSVEKLSKFAKHVRKIKSPITQADYAVNIFACLDRFSLDSVGFTCPTLKGIVDKHLPEEPLRVLGSVTIEWHEDRLIATLMPGSPLGKAMTLDEADENDFEDGDYDARCESVLRKTAALCANSFVKFFRMEEYGRWLRVLHAFEEHLSRIRIQRLMTVDYSYATSRRTSRTSMLLREPRLRSGIACDENGERDIDDESLRLLKERGIRRLAVEVLYNSVVGEDAVRAFCIGEPETADTVAPDRSLFLHHADLSFEFLQQLAQECLAADASHMPTLTFYRYTDFAPPLPKAQARHMKYGRRCLHFRFHATAGPYEIIAQSLGNRMWKVSLRGGHSAVRRCSYMFRREHRWSEG
ncbi:hypothetical protein AAVH_35731 [Aphelenchoides avenae]|nr:hypothetical protein AAVH_35731 [Aphelenchus avenae]